jgi:hypothetical protein
MRDVVGKAQSRFASIRRETMNEQIPAALVVDPYGGFQVMAHDFGYERMVYSSTSLEDCLRQAAATMGKPLVFQLAIPKS